MKADDKPSKKEFSAIESKMNGNKASEWMSEYMGLEYPDSWLAVLSGNLGSFESIAKSQYAIDISSMDNTAISWYYILDLDDSERLVLNVYKQKIGNLYKSLVIDDQLEKIDLTGFYIDAFSSILKAIQIDSSVIDAVVYDEEDSILCVRFKTNGSIWTYNIEYQMYEEFMNAESKGKFFSKYIKGNEKEQLA